MKMALCHSGPNWPLHGVAYSSTQVYFKIVAGRLKEIQVSENKIKWTKMCVDWLIEFHSKHCRAVL